MLARAYTTQVPLSTEVTDIFAGTPLERAPGPGRFKLYGRHAAAQGTVILSAFLGASEELGKMPLNIGAGGPNIEDDVIGIIDAAPGEKLIVNLEETVGTATDPSVRLEFEEFSREELLQIAAGRRV